jgi:hypothetical protein
MLGHHPNCWWIRRDVKPHFLSRFQILNPFEIKLKTISSLDNKISTHFLDKLQQKFFRYNFKIFLDTISNKISLDKNFKTF